MVEIDGSAGGGQILRTALGLSMLSGESVTVTDVRGDRPDPGLKAQHRTAVEVAAAVSDAAVEGADLGSTEVTFDPGEPRGGDYEAEIGTAGSLTLLFDTLLPVATMLEDPLSLSATGGTDVKWSPPLSYYRRVKLPLLREHGLAVAVESERPGFYPVGSGRATLRLWPSSVSSITLDGEARAVDDIEARIYSLAADSLADSDVADRQADAAERELSRLDVDVVHREVTDAAAANPGSSVVVGLTGDGGVHDRDEIVAGFDACGEKGKRAEAVASDAVSDLAAFRETGAAVDEHLADQLLVFLALAGGRIVVPRLTDHVETNLAVCEAFGYDLSVEESDRGVVVRSG
jgi:RNA 3'-terminal phosphate cyclase (ATP)